MKYRRAVFIVAYAKTKIGFEYLILKRRLHWKGWEFPKGGKRIFEADKKAVRRELKEETGLKPIKIKRFKISGKYKYKKEYSDRRGYVGQTYKLYAVEVKKARVKLDKLEHSDYKWMNFEHAIKKLKWVNQRKCLRVVNEWLKNEI